MNRLLGSIAMFAVLVGCEPTVETPATTAPVVAPMTAAVATAATEPPAPTAEEVPVPEDFEGEVSASISEANYRAELDRIAGEIASANPQ